VKEIPEAERCLPEDNFSVLIRKLQEKHGELTSYRKKISWKFLQGKCPNAYVADFDDTDWDTISLPMRIDARKGESWLRAKIVVPEEISGVSISGSTAKLSSSVIQDKIDVYVNSEKVLSADYWADFRGPRIILDSNVKPLNEYVVAIHVHPKYEPVRIPEFRVTYSNVEKIAFEIDSFIHELRFAKVLDEDLAEKVSEEFDLSVFDKAPSIVIQEIERARVKLSKLADEAKKFKIHLVAHAHIDMNWLWPWEDTVKTIKETFKSMIKLMKKYPDFRFSQSQAVTYKVVEERFPDLFEAIKKYVKESRWDSTASMWVESDLNMGGTEALVRQFLYAKNYMKEVFDFEPKVCWQPDTFGHIWTMPQLMRKAGCKYYYFMRCGKGETIFWWESPDGTRVLAFTSRYNNFVTPGNIVDLAINLYKRYGLKTSMFVYGVGDHGGGATEEDIEAAHKIQKKPTLPQVIFSSTHKFFEQIEEELNSIDLPVIRDELQFIFDGCYTTHADFKRYNRLCERLLVDAEKFSAFSGTYPREALHKAWKNMLFNQFHDILCGSGAPEAYIYPRELAEEALRIANEVLRESLKCISMKIKYSRPGVPIVAFNPLAWERIDVIKAQVPSELIPKEPVIMSADGEMIPVQRCGDNIIFVAKVPPMGYRTFYLMERDEACQSSSNLVATENVIENEYFRVEVERESGIIKSLYDKSANRFVFKKDRYRSTKPLNSNLFQILYEVPHNMSAWVIGEISRIENLIRGAKVELVESGPVRATLRVTHHYRNSTIIQNISLYSGIPRIDFNVILDWKEVSNDEVEAPMLKVAYTPILGNSKATYEIPFGYIERPADGSEVPALRWVDVSDGEYGVSLLNDSKYGFDVKGNTIRMTLIRTSYSPDPKPDQGIHEINYSIYPHRKGWKEALTFRKGYELNHPIETFVVIEKTNLKPSVAEETSFLQVKPENVVVSCVKLGENSKDYIVRIYDAVGVRSNAEIIFGFNVKEAYEVDFLERDLKPLPTRVNTVRVTLQPFEIKTIRIKIKD